MIVLNATSDTLEALLAATATTQPDYFATFVTTTSTAYTPAESHGALNSASAVTVVSTPGASEIRQIKFISIFNRDNVEHTITVRINDGSGTRVLYTGRVLPNGMIQYSDGEGWTRFNSSGDRELEDDTPGLQAVVAGTVTTNRTLNFGTSGYSFNISSNSISAAPNTSISYTAFNDNGSYEVFNINWRQVLTDFATFLRVVIPGPLAVNRAAICDYLSVSNSTQASLTYSIALYERVSTTVLNQLWSASRSLSFTSGSSMNSSVYGGNSGPRIRTIDISNWAVTPGEYYLAYRPNMPASLTGSVSYYMINNRFTVGNINDKVGNFNVYVWESTSANQFAAHLRQASSWSSDAGPFPQTLGMNGMAIISGMVCPTISFLP